MQVKPLGDKILLRIIETPAKEVSGLLLPETSRRDYREAVVQATGPRYKGELRPGDVVYHVPFTGIERTVNGDPFVFVKEFELLGVIE